LKPAGSLGKVSGAVSTAVTKGIRVVVKSEYMSERSSPGAKQFVFKYTVRITNEGTETAQLRSRHWVITDGDGKVQEVRGDGVVGAQPVLKVGQHFEYTSGCVLPTPRGTMRGTYQMVRENGETFDAEIAPFALALPYSLN
jgi:ApaG protein